MHNLPTNNETDLIKAIFNRSLTEQMTSIEPAYSLKDGSKPKGIQWKAQKPNNPVRTSIINPEAPAPKLPKTPTTELPFRNIQLKNVPTAPSAANLVGQQPQISYSAPAPAPAPSTAPTPTPSVKAPTVTSAARTPTTPSILPSFKNLAKGAVKGIGIPVAAEMGTDIALQAAGMKGGPGKVEAGRGMPETDSPGALDYARETVSTGVGTGVGYGMAAAAGAPVAAGTAAAIGTGIAGWKAGRSIAKAAGWDEQDLGPIDLASELLKTKGSQSARAEEIADQGYLATKTQELVTHSDWYKQRRQQEAQMRAQAAQIPETPLPATTTKAIETPTAPTTSGKRPKIGSSEFMNLPAAERSKAYDEELAASKTRKAEAEAELEGHKAELETAKQRKAFAQTEIETGRQKMESEIDAARKESAERRARHDELLKTGSTDDIMAASDKRNQEFENWRNQRAKEGAPWAQTPRKPLAQVKAEAEAKVKGKPGTQDLINTVQDIVNLASKQSQASAKTPSTTQKFTKPEEWTNPMMPTNIKAFQLKENYYNTLSERLEQLEEASQQQRAEARARSMGFNLPMGHPRGRGSVNVSAIKPERLGLHLQSLVSARGGERTFSGEAEEATKEGPKQPSWGERLKPHIITLMGAAQDHKIELSKEEAVSASSGDRKRLLAKYAPGSDVHKAATEIDQIIKDVKRD